MQGFATTSYVFLFPPLVLSISPVDYLPDHYFRCFVFLLGVLAEVNRYLNIKYPPVGLEHNAASEVGGSSDDAKDTDAV